MPHFHETSPLHQMTNSAQALIEVVLCLYWLWGRAAAVWTISEPMCGGPVAAVDQVRVRVLPICIGLLRAKGASETYLPKDYT